MFKKIRHAIEFVFTLAFGVFVRALNTRQAFKVAAWLGRLGYALGISRKVALENLKHAFPDKSEAERRRIAKGSFESFMINMFEILRMPLVDPRLLLVDYSFEHPGVLDELYKRGRGIVASSGHFGNWEGMAAAALAYGYPITVMVGAQSNPWVDNLFNSFRTHCELSLVHLRDLRGVMACLKRNHMLALLGDQDGDKFGMFVPFLGKDASTLTGPAIFARKSGAPMMAAAAVRTGPGKYLIKTVPLPDPPAGLSEEMDTYFRLKAYNQALEAMIREYPEQWWWMHKRWEARPEHRLQGEERARAERGEIVFDTETQKWKEKVK